MFTRKFLLDLLERALSTFAQALLGAGTVIDFSDAKAYQIAGIAAAVAVLKCLAATRVGAPNSGSLLPADEDPPAAGDDGHGQLDGLAYFAVALIILLVILRVFHLI